MLNELISDASPATINGWAAQTTFKNLAISSSRYVREVNIGFNAVEQREYDSAHYFEKHTLFPVALLEKLNADLAMYLGLSVAPCVLATEKPQPTLVSLGLYDESMSIVQGVYKDLNLHNDVEERLYNFRNSRLNTIDIMRRQVSDDLHPKLKPYRDLLSETLPFLVWARIHDPNLSNLIDRAETINTPLSENNGTQRKSGYFIDLEGDVSLIDSHCFREADWDHMTIDPGDIALVLRDWLADKLPIEEIFNAEKIWQTIERIEALPDNVIRLEQGRISEVANTYEFIDEDKKAEIIRGLGTIGDMLIERRGQLANFMRLYIPKPANADHKHELAPAFDR